MRPKVPAFLMAAVSIGICGCQPHLSAVDRQRLNHALTYFIYAQADVQLSRRAPFGKHARYLEAPARNWALQGLRQPALVETAQKVGVHGGIGAAASPIGFLPKIELGASLERLYKVNPKAPLADTLIQLFNDAQATWEPREGVWHLSHVYHDDYELIRNDDRFRFFLAFYEDPYPETTRD